MDKHATVADVATATREAPSLIATSATAFYRERNHGTQRDAHQLASGRAPQVYADHCSNDHAYAEGRSQVAMARPWTLPPPPECCQPGRLCLLGFRRPLPGHCRCRIVIRLIQRSASHHRCPIHMASTVAITTALGVKVDVDAKMPSTPDGGDRLSLT